MYFDDFLSRLKGDLPNFVLLFGDSDGVISEGARALKEKFRKKMPDGTIQAFDGGQDSLGEILAAAQTVSLFAASQLLVVQHAEKIVGGHSEAALQQLKDYFTNPNSSSYLVFLAPGLRKTTKAVAAAERMGWAVQCSDIPEWKLAGWLKQQAQSRGLTLPEEAAQILVQKIGPDIAYLQRALEQLADYAYPQNAVTAAMVKELPVPGVESEIFPLLDAVGMRQAEKALAMMGQLQDGVDTGTVMLLYGRMRELLMIALGKAKGLTQSNAAEKLGLHPFRLKTLWDQASQFSTEELKSALMDLIHLQAGVVTGRLSRGVPAVMLEMWVLKWGRKRQLTAHR
ncbi:MAG TPA: DNA polymerase III subunit delta [bacterium]|nr:DNA polymerase III subunit delta [bacterium]